MVTIVACLEAHFPASPTSRKKTKKSLIEHPDQVLGCPVPGTFLFTGAVEQLLSPWTAGFLASDGETASLLCTEVLAGIRTPAFVCLVSGKQREPTKSKNI